MNRKVPPSKPVPQFPVFATEPTEREIKQARVFSEPLVPVGGGTAPAENKSLARALTSYSRREDPEDTTAVVEFLGSYPNSAWRASLLANLGSAYRRSGRFSKALRVWEEAWHLTKDETDALARAVGDRAVGELAVLFAWMGRCARLEALLAEIGGRDVRGPAHQRIAAARQGLWLMRHRPEDAFHCGPLSLQRIRADARRESSRDAGSPSLGAAWSLPLGTTLPQLESFAWALGLRMQMAKRTPGSAVTFPAVVHWSLGPFAAILTAEKGRYLVYDPSFDEEMWVTVKTLDEEASGYFLVPEGSLPKGWRAVEHSEGERIWYPEPFVFKETTRSSSPGRSQWPPSDTAIHERTFGTRPASVRGCAATARRERLGGAQGGPSTC